MGSHREVRRALARGLAAVACARASPEPDLMEQLHASMRGVVVIVRRQVLDECVELASVLEHLDAWGPERLHRMEELHEREHAAAHCLMCSAVAGADIGALASVMEGSIREILRVLRIEERELLDSDLLDDDTTVRISDGG